MREKRKYQISSKLGLLLLLMLLFLSTAGGIQQKEVETEIIVNNPFLLQLHYLMQPTVERKEREFFNSYIKNKEIVKELYIYRRKLDLELLVSLMYQESSFKVNAINKNKSSTDHGLFQLNSSIYPKYSKEELEEISTNISLGVQHLQKELLYFKGDVKKALQAYNAGRSRVIKNTVPYKSKVFANRIIKRALEIKAQKAAFISRSL